MSESFLESLLACPVTGSPLRRKGEGLVSDSGASYPIIDGVPVIFHPDSSDSIGAMAVSRTARSAQAEDPLRLDTLDVNAEHRERLGVEVQAMAAGGPVDPVVSQMIAATSGNLYRHLVGSLPRYPIPDFRLKNGGGRLLLDIGCNWGRWSFAAAKEGFVPVGIDPQLGAVLAARRVAGQLGVKAHFVCGDARHLPFRREVFDVVYSYSVLQHLARAEVATVLDSAAACMTAGGTLLAQMPNQSGVRNLMQQARRGLREAGDFEVRYWRLAELRRMFERHIGPVALAVDCFFGIGLQAADVDLMRPGGRCLVVLSEFLRKSAERLPLLLRLADSVFVQARKTV